MWKTVGGKPSTFPQQVFSALCTRGFHATAKRAKGTSGFFHVCTGLIPIPMSLELMMTGKICRGGVGG